MFIKPARYLNQNAAEEFPSLNSEYRQSQIEKIYSILGKAELKNQDKKELFEISQNIDVITRVLMPIANKTPSNETTKSDLIRVLNMGLYLEEKSLEEKSEQIITAFKTNSNAANMFIYSLEYKEMLTSEKPSDKLTACISILLQEGSRSESNQKILNIFLEKIEHLLDDDKDIVKQVMASLLNTETKKNLDFAKFLIRNAV